MMINKISYSPSFQKKLVATAGIIHNGEVEPCQIYRLNKKEDIDYIPALMKNRKWANYEYLKNLKVGLEVNSPLLSYMYSLEDKNNECLGIMEIDRSFIPKHKILNYIETLPSNRKIDDNDKRDKFRYIGETLLAFAAKEGLRKGTKKIDVPYPVVDARPFYRKCGFVKPSRKDMIGLYIDRDKMQKLVDKNDEHTQTRIKFVQEA